MDTKFGAAIETGQAEEFVKTALGLKEIPGYKSYISVDGGMTDNPRYALYKARYTAYLASDMGREYDGTYTLAGRCCESGDIIIEKMRFPRCRRGDIIAVAATGAYNYSMASNYNRFPRPPIVMIKDGRASIAVRRESIDDMLACDL